MIYLVIDNEGQVLSAWDSEKEAEFSRTAYSCDTHIVAYPINVVL